MSAESEDILVVKFGSRALTGEPASMETLECNIRGAAEDLACYAGKLVIVTSGAVFCGRLTNPDIESEAVLATIGNPRLFGIWQQAFLASNAVSSQVLVTHRELDIASERERLTEVLSKSMAAGVVPIINENDALSDTELKKLSYGGDNDGLAAAIAKLMSAKQLVLFTDTEGFMIDCQVQAELNLSTDTQLFDHASGSDRGGGMVAKIEATKSFLGSDLSRVAHIARAGNSLKDVLGGNTGTRITA